MKQHITQNQTLINSFQLKEPSYLAVFINGVFMPQLSTPPKQLASCLRTYTLLLESCDGISLRFLLPRNQILSQPLHLLFITTENITAKKLKFFITINSEANSSATIIEEHVSCATKKVLHNIKTTITAAKNTKINYTKLFHSIARSSSAYTSNTIITQRPTSNVVINYGIKESAAVNENLKVTLQEKTISKVLGWCEVGENQNITVTSLIEHRGNAATSEELFKYILRDNSKGSFTGNILVPEKVTQSSAKLYNKNLLLSPAAKMHTAPILEIYADDVAAHHGAATGQLDEAALFYLQTRGLKLKAAREILTHAFIAEVTAQFPEVLQDKISQLID